MAKKNSELAVDQLFDDLFPQSAEIGVRSATEVQWIDLSLIDPNPFQPRRIFSAAAQNKLLKSLIGQGQLQPVLVRPREDGRFQLVAGERRWRAANQSDGRISQLLAVVRPLSDYEALVASWHENDDRENIGPLESGRFFLRLGTVSLGTPSELAEKTVNSGKIPSGFPWDEVATAVGLSKRSVRRYIDLLKLHPTLQDWFLPVSDLNDLTTSIGQDETIIEEGAADVRTAKLRTEKHGRALLMLSGDIDLQIRLLANIDDEQLAGDAAIRRATEIRNEKEKQQTAKNLVLSSSVPRDTANVKKSWQRFERALGDLERIALDENAMPEISTEVWKDLLERLEPLIQQLRGRVDR